MDLIGNVQSARVFPAWIESQIGVLRDRPPSLGSGGRAGVCGNVNPAVCLRFIAFVACLRPATLPDE
jgi:hypothetical protein